MTRIPFEQAVEELGLMRKLRAFQPCVIGTPPLGIALESSDIDVACCAVDLAEFEQTAMAVFGEMDRFQMRRARLQEQDSVVVQFRACEWEIELFCQQIPTGQQWGVRHFLVEKRILTIEPKLIESVRQRKLAGQKTEPAFAEALGLSGEPYEAVLDLENLSDSELADLIRNRPV